MIRLQAYVGNSASQWNQVPSCPHERSSCTGYDSKEDSIYRVRTPVASQVPRSQGRFVASDFVEWKKSAAFLQSQSLSKFFSLDLYQR